MNKHCKEYKTWIESKHMGTRLNPIIVRKRALSSHVDVQEMRSAGARGRAKAPRQAPARLVRKEQEGQGARQREAEDEDRDRQGCRPSISVSHNAVLDLRD